MRLYATVAASGFRRHATYRVATAAGVFTNTVFGFITAYTYIALWHERPHLGGYDQSMALTYVWIGQALFATSSLMGGGFQDELMGARCERVEGPRQWIAFPAAASAAPLVAELAARHGVVDLSVREPAIEDVIARMYAASSAAPA